MLLLTALAVYRFVFIVNENKKSLKIYFDGNVEENGQWIDTILPEHEDERCDEFFWIKMKD